MNYCKFKNQVNILEKLLEYLDVLISKSLILKINNYPDYKLSTYKREVISEYYFKNSWSFKNLYREIIDAKFISNKIYHSDIIDEEDNYDFSELHLDYDLEKNLNVIHKHYDDYFQGNGYSLNDIDDFKVNELRLILIDNIKKVIVYEGSFLGNNDNINTLDYGIFSLIKITGIRKDLEEFYQNLLAETYLLYKQASYKLSFFLCYSAIECFVNIQLNSAEKEERLIDKLKDLFKAKYNNISKNLIYTSIINDFSNFTDMRNIIGHGKQKIEISEFDVQSILYFTTVLIASYNNEFENFTELNTELKNNNHR